VHDFVRLLCCDDQGIVGCKTEISGGAQLNINMRGGPPGTLRHFRQGAHDAIPRSTVHDFIRLLCCDDQGIVGSKTEISAGAQLNINMRGVPPGTLRHFRQGAHDAIPRSTVHDFVRLLCCDDQGIVGSKTEISGGAQLNINMRGVPPSTLRHFRQGAHETAAPWCQPGLVCGMTGGVYGGTLTGTPCLASRIARCAALLKRANLEMRSDISMC
jgi:hypothetical protein